MIYIVRHTTPKVEKGICYGQSDLDVDSSFCDELIRVKQKLKINSDFKFISSPLKRCSKLANEIAQGADVYFDNRLKELDFGLWEMLAWKDMDQEQLKAWSSDFVNSCPPNGESFKEFSMRVMDFWNELDLLNTDYVIVAHDGVLRVILSQLLEIPQKKAFNLKLRYGEVIGIKFFDKENCKIEFCEIGDYGSGKIDI